MEAAELTDQQLVDRANAGDRSAFEALYLRYKGWAFRIALRETGRDEGLAADAVQDSFIELLGKFPGFELRAKLTTYLYPVVKHNAQAADRKRRRKTPSGPEVERSDHDPPPDPEGLDGLRTVIDTLPEHHREVVFMRFLDDLSLNEIALALGIPLGTVKSRLHHAIGALRDDPVCRKYFEVDP
ncbi:MAG: RNA polymerase sigma factor [Phycisphaerales bacterium JB065]